MNDNLVQRLRATIDGADHLTTAECLCCDAADRIEQLEAALDRILAAHRREHADLPRQWYGAEPLWDACLEAEAIVEQTR